MMQVPMALSRCNIDHHAQQMLTEAIQSIKDSDFSSNVRRSAFPMIVTFVMVLQCSTGYMRAAETNYVIGDTLNTRQNLEVASSSVHQVFCVKIV